ncbi:uncharacterized protein [Mytilus edulis]|uniref:uncharacterized protein n=1 Tax=Mytilus edulis TaxID=6550 RepID=UPI0039EECF5A
MSDVSFFILGRSGNWNHAINSCLLSDKTLLKDLDIIKNGWLDYFQYTEVKSNHRCIAITRKDGNQPLSYQYRSCSDQLPTLCKIDNNSGNFNTKYSSVFHDSTESLKPSSANVSDVQGSGEISTDNKNIDLCIKIAAGGTASFATITMLLLVIIFIQRRKLTKASYTTLSVRRDQNTYNQVPHEMSDSITGQHYEVSPLSEIPTSGCQITAQQNIAIIQHIDTSGYLIPSGMLETDGDYQTITD